jgi:hypothetical protein
MNKFVSSPHATHMVAAKKIFKYIRGTTNYGIFFLQDGRDASIFYVDAN